MKRIMLTDNDIQILLGLTEEYPVSLSFLRGQLLAAKKRKKRVVK